MSQDLDPIEDLLNQLENDESSNAGGDYHNITKLQMAFPDNHGMIMFAPFQGTIDGKKSFYTLITGVCEYKCRIPSVDNGNSDTWIRILPKEFYGELSAEDSALYDQVKNLFDQVNDKHEEGDKWKVIRFRSYSLFYGVLLKQVNKAQENITENIGKSVLLIYPSRCVVNELGKAIKAKTNALNGNRAWVANVFDATNSQREGAMVVSFERPETGAYTASVSFEFNSTFSQVVEKTYPEEDPTLFKDPVSDFIGRFNGKDGKKFNAELFKEFGKALSIDLKDPGVSVESPTPEIKNGVDPMISSGANGGSVPTGPAPTEAPTQPMTAAQASAGVSIPGIGNLPF